MNNQLATTEFINALLENAPGLKPLYKEHVDYYDEFLSHVFFGDVTRYIAKMLESGSPHDLAAANQVLEALERGMEFGDNDVQELISVSFLENLVKYEDALSKARELMGPNLTKELSAYL